MGKSMDKINQHMKKENRIQFEKRGICCKTLMLFGLLAILCAGCGETTAANVQSEGADHLKVVAMEETPIVDYVVPQQFSNIMVDAAGYRTEGGKRAAMKGRKLPTTFSLIDAQTEETVYTGMLENVQYNAEQGIYSAYADFSAWKQDGTYYLQCEYIGRSYDFMLETGLYERRFHGICREMAAECRAQTVTNEDVKRLLLAYEWYGEIFADDDENTIPDVLEAVADWIELTETQNIQTGQVATPGQEASYAAVLAKFSYLYQKYDKQYATDCLKRASVIFDQTQSTMQKDAECFHALTELYRATGVYTYGNQIAEYKTYFQSHTGFTEELGYLYGAMTYLSTRQRVDMELCTIFMDALMAQGERISDVYGEMVHPVTARNNGAEDLLAHAEQLACANYVMNNYQYNHVMEEFLHYLRGRNTQSVDFYEADMGEKTEYLLMLTQLVAVKDNLGEEGKIK